MTPKFISVHLFGGPLDGADEPNVPETTHGLAWMLAGCYSYCPHATAYFTATRKVETTVFIHETIAHDFFHPSLNKGAD